MSLRNIKVNNDNVISIDNTLNQNSDNLIQNAPVSYNIKKTQLIGNYFIVNPDLTTDKDRVFYAIYDGVITEYYNENRIRSAYIPVNAGDSFEFCGDQYNLSIPIIQAIDENFNLVLDQCIYSDVLVDYKYTYTVPENENIKYIIFCSSPVEWAYVKCLAHNSTNYIINSIYDNLKKSNDDLKNAIKTEYVQIKYGKNICNKDDLKYGYFDVNGNIYSNDSYSYITMIVEPNTQYTVSGAVFGSENTYNVFFNDNVVLSTEAGNYSENRTFTTPNNCNKFGITLLTNTITDTLQVEKGSVVTQYEEYSPISGYINKNNSETEIKHYAPDISNFNNWNLISAGCWTISSDGKSATSLLNGYQNYIQYSNYRSVEDHFNLSLDITPLTGDNNGYFEIAMGRFYALSGTVCSVGKDSEGNFYALYSINASNIPELKTKQYFSGLRFGLNKTVTVQLNKRTTSDGYFYITITDEAGNVIQVDSLHPGTYGWGKIVSYVITGTAKIEKPQFGFPLDNNNIKLLIFGHSFVEGNSISGQKDLRWCAKLRNDLGDKNVAIFGWGGGTIDTMSYGYLENIQWLSSARYALIMLGTNDADSSATCVKMQNVNDKLIEANIIPFWTTNAPTYPNGQVKPTIESYIEGHFNYIDINPAFYDDNGDLDETMFLTDHVHPSIACHEKIYKIIKAKMSFLFNI